MIIAIPDVNLESMTLEELKEHAKLCAVADNTVRSHAIATQSMIIRRLNERTEGYDRTIDRAKKLTAKVRSINRKPVGTRTVADILSICEEDEPTIDDFK